MESATGQADAVVVSSVAADWVHYWKSYHEDQAQCLGYQRRVPWRGSCGPSVSGRRRVFFQPKRWVELGAQYRYETRTSDDPLAEYTDNVFMLTLDARY